MRRIHLSDFTLIGNDDRKGGKTQRQRKGN
jgi:hypothetical protein